MPLSTRTVYVTPAIRLDESGMWVLRAYHEQEIKRLRAAIEDYSLWEPGRAGHAAAHRKLMEAIDDA